MKKNLKWRPKLVSLMLLTVTGILSGLSQGRVNQLGVEATAPAITIENRQTPSHPFAYKLGAEEDVETVVKNNELISKKQQAALKEAREAERIAKENVEKLAQADKELDSQAQATTTLVENQQVAADEKASSEKKNVQPTQSSANSNPSSQTPQHKTKSSSGTKQEAVHKAPTKTAPPKQSPPAAKQESIGNNKIGINGTFKSYSNYGSANTDQLQSGIDSGLIVAGLTNFNGNDGQTTYFGGHNPGIMKFIANTISVGSTITITDGNGQAHHYKMIDKVDVDEYGEGMLTSIGKSAIDAYMYGTGTESILIQFCNTNNNLMSFWYGVKM